MKFCLSALVVALSASVGSSSNSVGISALFSNDSSAIEQGQGRQLAPAPKEPCVVDCECGDQNGMFVPETFTVAQAACGLPEFSILCKALNFAGLFDALNGPDSELTVWAPPDSAFLLLPEATRDFLFSDEGKELLTNILLLHVATPQLVLKDLECGKRVNTLQGQQTKTECLFTAGGTRGFQIGLGSGDDKPEMIGETVMCNGNLFILDQVMIPGGPDDTFSSFSKSDKKAKTSGGRKGKRKGNPSF